MKKTRIITYGTYDVFHTGHLRLLKRLSEMCDTLIVGVATDEFISTKGKNVVIPYQQRAEIVKAISYVDIVIAENSREQIPHDIKKHNIDIFAMGSDWQGEFDYLENLCQVLYLPRTEGISSTAIKSFIANA